MQLFNDLARAIKETEVPKASVAIFWLVQASFVLKGSDGTTLAIDPYFSGGARRLLPPPFPAADLDVDAVLFTHDHLDHYDPHAVPEIAAAAPHTIFVGPDSCLELARRDGIAEGRLTRLNRGQTVQVKGARVSAVYAEHLTVGEPAVDAVGLVIELGGIRLYHTGDTVYNEQLQRSGKELGPVDVLMTPINGNFAVMNSLDAVLYTKDVGPRVVIPMHYGTFAGNTADPYMFVNTLKERGVEARPVVMSNGSGYLYQQK